MLFLMLLSTLSLCLLPLLLWNVFVFILLGFVDFLGYIDCFYQIWNVSSHYFFKYFFFFFSFLSFWSPLTLVCLMVLHISLRLWSFFFSLFSGVWITYSFSIYLQACLFSLLSVQIYCWALLMNFSLCFWYFFFLSMLYAQCGTWTHNFMIKSCMLYWLSQSGALMAFFNSRLSIWFFFAICMSK